MLNAGSGSITLQLQSSGGKDMGARTGLVPSLVQLAGRSFSRQQALSVAACAARRNKGTTSSDATDEQSAAAAQSSGRKRRRLGAAKPTADMPPPPSGATSQAMAAVQEASSSMKVPNRAALALELDKFTAKLGVAAVDEEAQSQAKSNGTGSQHVPTRQQDLQHASTQTSSSGGSILAGNVQGTPVHHASARPSARVPWDRPSWEHPTRHRRSNTLGVRPPAAAQFLPASTQQLIQPRSHEPQTQGSQRSQQGSVVAGTMQQAVHLGTALENDKQKRTVTTPGLGRHTEQQMRSTAGTGSVGVEVPTAAARKQVAGLRPSPRSGTRRSTGTGGASKTSAPPSALTPCEVTQAAAALAASGHPFPSPVIGDLLLSLPGMAPGAAPASAEQLLQVVKACSTSQLQALAEQLQDALYVGTAGTEMELFVFDTETTGFKLFSDILEIHMEHIGSGDTFNTLVNPITRTKDEELLKALDNRIKDTVHVHQITPSMLTTAPSSQPVTLALLAWILQRCRAAGGRVPLLVAHNAVYDVKMLQKEMFTLKSPMLLPTTWRKLDTIQVIRKATNDTLSSYKLATLPADLGLKIPGANHRAAQDVTTLKAVLDHVLEKAWGTTNLSQLIKREPLQQMVKDVGPERNAFLKHNSDEKKWQVDKRATAEQRDTAVRLAATVALEWAAQQASGANASINATAGYTLRVQAAPEAKLPGTSAAPEGAHSSTLHPGTPPPASPSPSQLTSIKPPAGTAAPGEAPTVAAQVHAGPHKGTDGPHEAGMGQSSLSTEESGSSGWDEQIEAVGLGGHVWGTLKEHQKWEAPDPIAELEAAVEGLPYNLTAGEAVARALSPDAAGRRLLGSKDDKRMTTAGASSQAPEVLGVEGRSQPLVPPSLRGEEPPPLDPLPHSIARRSVSAERVGLGPAVSVRSSAEPQGGEEVPHLDASSFSAAPLSDAAAALPRTASDLAYAMHDHLHEASTTAVSEAMQQERTEAAQAAKRKRGAGPVDGPDRGTEGWHLLGLTHTQLTGQVKAKDKWYTDKQAGALTKAHRPTPLALLLTVPKYYKSYAPVLDLSGRAASLQNELPVPKGSATGGWEGEEEVEDEEEETRRRNRKKKEVSRGGVPVSAQRIRLEATLVSKPEKQPYFSGVYYLNVVVVTDQVTGTTDQTATMKVTFVMRSRFDTILGRVQKDMPVGSRVIVMGEATPAPRSGRRTSKGPASDYTWTVEGEDLQLVEPAGASAISDEGHSLSEFIKPVYSHFQALKQVKSKLYHTGKKPDLIQHTLGKIDMHGAATDPLESLPGMSGLALMPWRQALQEVHRPASIELMRQAVTRLAFQEMFFLQLQLIRQRAEFLRGGARRAAVALVNDFRAVEAAVQHSLGFSLTSAQAQALREVLDDMARPAAMFRLLQGDVGSGKTAVALLAMLATAGSGYQALLLAPTETLASQHLATLTRLWKGLPAAVRNQGLLKQAPAALTQDALRTARARRETEEGVRAGSLGLLVGTTSVLGITGWARLGLVVVDEQQKFGVRQKEELLGLCDTLHPHVLSMTATPIPRTLALVNFGEMVVSALYELPPGRQPVATQVVTDDEGGQQAMYEAIRTELAAGGRAFILYPMRESSTRTRQADSLFGWSEAPDASEEVKGACDDLERLKKSGVLGPHAKLALLHGGMDGPSKHKAVEDLRRGAINVLLCTTVVEVGVDVPEASIMVVQHADRFGLAQLHQIRGRVGRGSRPSRCYLMASPGLPEETLDRIKVMESCYNGLDIAEADLRIRGAGSVLSTGTRQSGAMDCTKLCADAVMANPLIIERARTLAAQALMNGLTPILHAAADAYQVLRNGGEAAPENTLATSTAASVPSAGAPAAVPSAPSSKATKQKGRSSTSKTRAKAGQSNRKRSSTDESSTTTGAGETSAQVKGKGKKAAKAKKARKVTTKATKVATKASKAKKGAATVAKAGKRKSKQADHQSEAAVTDSQAGSSAEGGEPQQKKGRKRSKAKVQVAYGS